MFKQHFLLRYCFTSSKTLSLSAYMFNQHRIIQAKSRALFNPNQASDMRHENVCFSPCLVAKIEISILPVVPNMLAKLRCVAVENWKTGGGERREREQQNMTVCRRTRMARD